MKKMKKIHFTSFPRSGSHIVSLLISKTFELNIQNENPAISKKFYTNYTNPNGILVKTHNSLEDKNLFTHKILLIRNPLESIIRHNEWDLMFQRSKGTKFETSHTKEKFIPSYSLRICSLLKPKFNLVIDFIVLSE